MKIYSILKKLQLLLLFAVTAVAGCKKSFFDGTTQSSYTVEEVYATASGVQAATAALYGQPWFFFNCQFSMGIGDVCSGNSTGDADADMLQFQNVSFTTGNQYLYKGWASLYQVIGQANAVMKNISLYSSGVETSVLNVALAEARFHRAIAYFYLVRLYGEVPIIPETLDIETDYLQPKHIVKDIYKFIITDLEFAETYLPDTQTDAGRVSKGAAQALLAKVYLTRAANNADASITPATDYAAAAEEAWTVISNKATYGYELLSDYADLFYTKNNNNSESIFALQWVASNASGAYGTGNVTQSYCAAYNQGLTGGTDGWGSFRPTLDIQTEFQAEGIVSNVYTDLRRKPTYMVNPVGGSISDTYSELLQASGGYTYPGYLSLTGGNAKKYVVGTYADNASTGGVYNMSTGINTYMIRYADVLLTYAEAVLAGGTSTSDANALAAFNEVRNRAGLASKTSISFTDILHERRLEFAFEGMYWYDVLRMPQADAITWLSQRERGRYSGYGGGSVVSNKIIFDASKLLFSIPQSEIDQNPNLAADVAAVSYY
ncbi:MAG: RagB/SusD family nutrient uptake outer membrane protein [Niabella sp.]